MRLRSCALLALAAVSAFAAPPVRVSDSGRMALPPGIGGQWRPIPGGVVVASDDVALGVPLGRWALLWTSPEAGETSRIEFERPVDDFATTPSGDRAAVLSDERITLYTRGGRVLGTRAAPELTGGFFVRGDLVYGTQFLYDAAEDLFTFRPAVYDLRRGSVRLPYGEMEGFWADVSEDGRAQIVDFDSLGLALDGPDGGLRFFPSTMREPQALFLSGGRRMAVLSGPDSGRVLAYADAPDALRNPVTLPPGFADLRVAGPNGATMVATRAPWSPVDTNGLSDLYVIPFGGAPRLASVRPDGTVRTDGPLGSAGFAGAADRVYTRVEGRFFRRDLTRDRSVAVLRPADTGGDAWAGGVSEDGNVGAFLTYSDLYGPRPTDPEAATLVIWRRGAGLRVFPEVDDSGDLDVSPAGRYVFGDDGALDLTTDREVRLFTDRAKRPISLPGSHQFLPGDAGVVYRSEDDSRFLLRDPATNSVRLFGGDSTNWNGGRFLGAQDQFVGYAKTETDAEGAATRAVEVILDAETRRVVARNLWTIPEGLRSPDLAVEVRAIADGGEARILSGFVPRMDPITGTAYYVRGAYRVVGSGRNARWVEIPAGRLSSDGRWWITAQGVTEVATGLSTPLSFAPRTRPLGPWRVYFQGTDLFAARSGR